VCRCAALSRLLRRLEATGCETLCVWTSAFWPCYYYYYIRTSNTSYPTQSKFCRPGCIPRMHSTGRGGGHLMHDVGSSLQNKERVCDCLLSFFQTAAGVFTTLRHLHARYTHLMHSDLSPWHLHALAPRRCVVNLSIFSEHGGLWHSTSLARIRVRRLSCRNRASKLAVAFFPLLVDRTSLNVGVPQTLP